MSGLRIGVLGASRIAELAIIVPRRDARAPHRRGGGP